MILFSIILLIFLIVNIILLLKFNEDISSRLTIFNSHTSVLNCLGIIATIFAAMLTAGCIWIYYLTLNPLVLTIIIKLSIYLGIGAIVSISLTWYILFKYRKLILSLICNFTLSEAYQRLIHCIYRDENHSIIIDDSWIFQIVYPKILIPEDSKFFKSVEEFNELIEPNIAQMLWFPTCLMMLWLPYLIYLASRTIVICVNRIFNNLINCQINYRFFKITTQQSGHIVQDILNENCSK